LKLLHALVVSIALLRPTLSSAQFPVPPLIPLIPYVAPVDPNCVKDGKGWWFLAADGTFAYAETCEKAHDLVNKLPPPVHQHSYFNEGAPVGWRLI
jgi:hypothetical protein